MRFEANWRCYSTRYCGGIIGLGIILGWIVIYPVALGKGFIFFELFRKFFLSDIKLTGMFLGVCVYGQVIFYISSNNLTKSMVVSEDVVTCNLFNKKVCKLKYSDLSSLEYNNDLYKIFLFTFKDGRKQKISNSVKNSELAFEMIRKKIAEANG